MQSTYYLINVYQHDGEAGEYTDSFLTTNPNDVNAVAERELTSAYKNGRACHQREHQRLLQERGKDAQGFILINSRPLSSMITVADLPTS